MAWDGAVAGATHRVAGAGAAAIRMAMGIMVVGGGAGTAATSPMVGIDTEHESRQVRSPATGLARGERLKRNCRLARVSSLQDTKASRSRFVRPASLSGAMPAPNK